MDAREQDQPGDGSRTPVLPVDPEPSAASPAAPKDEPMEESRGGETSAAASSTGPPTSGEVPRGSQTPIAVLPDDAGASASAPCGSETPAPECRRGSAGSAWALGARADPTPGPEPSEMPEAGVHGRGDAARGSRTPAPSAEPKPMDVDEEAPSGKNLLSNFMPAPPMCAPPTCIVSKDVVDVGTFVCAPLGPFGAIDYHGHPIRPDGPQGPGPACCSSRST